MQPKCSARQSCSQQITHHIFCDVIVVYQKGTSLIVDGGHGSDEVHTPLWPILVYIHLQAHSMTPHNRLLSKTVDLHAAIIQLCIAVRTQQVCQLSASHSEQKDLQSGVFISLFCCGLHVDEEGLNAGRPVGLGSLARSLCRQNHVE